MVRQMRCPCCAANLVYNKECDLFFCEYCGHAERVVTRVVERVGSPAPVKTIPVTTSGTKQFATKPSGLAVLALILAVMPCTGFWGMLIGFIDIANSDKKGEPQQKLSAVAVVIGFVFWVLGMAVFFGSIVNAK
ncbi:MAG: hypothetical protein IK020_10465 [Clostridiales bacterium]|nr:hypothetical protein [Clostridiales bacterium]